MKKLLIIVFILFLCLQIFTENSQEQWNICVLVFLDTSIQKTSKNDIIKDFSDGIKKTDYLKLVKQKEVDQILKKLKVSDYKGFNYDLRSQLYRELHADLALIYSVTIENDDLFIDMIIKILSKDEVSFKRKCEIRKIQQYHQYIDLIEKSSRKDLIECLEKEKAKITEKIPEKILIPQDIVLKDYRTNKTYTLKQLIGKTLIIGIFDYKDSDTLKKMNWDPLLLDKLQKIFPDYIRVFFGFRTRYEFDRKNFLDHFTYDYPVVDAQNLEEFLSKYYKYIYNNFYIVNPEGYIEKEISSFSFSSDLDYITRENIIQKFLLYLSKDAKPLKFPLSITEAAMQNNLSEVKKLLKKGTDCNRLEYRFSPLHWAVKNNNGEIVKILLENGADPNIMCDGITPLFDCMNDKMISITKLLMEHNANPYIRCNSFALSKTYKIRGKTAYQIAKDRGQNKTIQYLKSVMKELSYLADDPLSYKEILKKGITPKIDPGYEFPCSKQEGYNCFAYTIKHIVQYKYKKIINIKESEKIIFSGEKKPWLWFSHTMNAFTRMNNIMSEPLFYTNDLFLALHRGEPVALSYIILLASDKGKKGGDESMVHWAVAYSFDNKGIWVSDSAYGKRIHLPYEKIYEKNGINNKPLCGYCTIKRTKK